MNPSDQQLSETQDARITFLDSRIASAIRAGRIDDGFLALAKERLALGERGDRHPFDHCLTAARLGHPDALMALLDLGYSPIPERERRHAQNINWQSLLARCGARNLTEPIKRLVAIIAVDSPGPNGSTALMAAAANGAEEAGFLLLSLGADPLYRSASGWGPIASAALGDCPALAKELLARGADPHAPSAEGMSAVEHAKERGSPQFLAIVEAHQIEAATSQPSARPKRALGL